MFKSFLYDQNKFFYPLIFAILWFRESEIGFDISKDTLCE